MDHTEAREALADLIDTDRSERVYEWPDDEADYHRNGDFTCFTDRAEKVARFRKLKVADAILAAGWTPPATPDEATRATMEARLAEIEACQRAGVNANDDARWLLEQCRTLLGTARP